MVWLLLLAGAAGCQSPIGLKHVSEGAWVRSRQDSALNSNRLSTYASRMLKQRGFGQRELGQAIETLHVELQNTHSRRTVAALAEVCYLRAKRHKKGSPEATRLYLTASLLAYTYMFDETLDKAASPFEAQFHLACGIYNHGLAHVVFDLRDRGARWGSAPRVDTILGPVEFEFGHNDLAWGTATQQFDGVLTTYEFEVRGLDDHLRTSGLGVPLILLRTPPETPQTQQDRFLPRARRQSFPATVLMRPRESVLQVPDADAHTLLLECFDPTRVQDVTINGQRVALETDTTTPLAYMLENAPLPKGITGLLDAPAWKDRQGLYMILPYQPGKIPVVFVHGLASSPMTWLPMINNLLGDEEVRARYQFWYFLYPSGNPILYNAATLRASLRDAQRAFDPESVDPAFNNMVFVGHSMGGLLSRLNVVDSSDQIWSALFASPFESLDISEEQRQILEGMMFFEPLPFLRRVIFIATPHRGSRLADLWLTREVGDRVTLSQELAEGEAALAEYMRPEVRDQMGEETSSLDSLSENNPTLHALDTIPFPARIKYHSIIADQKSAGRAGGSDTIVEYKSSNLQGAESEKIIHGVHTCTGHPEVIHEVRRILLLHARELGMTQPAVE
jgi:pimeloyl-ACP methyl ester carboxylesterase